MNNEFFEFDTKKAVCFSGHRPHKLPGHGVPDDKRTLRIKEAIHFTIIRSLKEGYYIFLSGLAEGIDLWASEEVIKMKKFYPHIKLVAVKPMPNQGQNFSDEGKKLLKNALENADYIVCTSEHYSKNCYRIRNEYMVDHSDRLIAFVSGDAVRSGTIQTLNYAKKLNKKTTVINVNNVVADSCQLSLYY